MSIYTSEKVLPYVYMCIHKITGQVYIGSRTSPNMKCPSHIDLPKYKTSSKFVKPIFEEFDWHIVAEFFEGEDAYDFEQNLIHEYWEIDKSNSLNKVCYHGKLRFYTTGIPKSQEHKDAIGRKSKGRKASAETRLKISIGKKGKKYSDDAKKNMGWKDGMKHREESKQKMSDKATGRPKSESHKKALSESAKKQKNNKFRRKQDIVTCPHCGKSGGELTMPRWHFDRCKFKL